MRGALVVGQIATALLLLTLAGLVARTFWNVTAIDAGFRGDNLTTVSIPLYLRHYPMERLGPFYDELLARVRALPLVTDAAIADAAPLSGRRASLEPTDGGSLPKTTIDLMAVTPRYFETLGARVRGREFTADDREKSQPVVIVNSTFARMMYGGKNPIGILLDIEGAPRLIVGVSPDILQRELEEGAKPQVYFPLSQQEATAGEHILVRTSGSADAVKAAIAQIVSSLDATLPRPTFLDGEQLLNEATAPRRFTFILLGVFAAIAGSLAVVGLYGLLAHLVADRTREIGIRLALGADQRGIVRLIAGQGAALALMGVIIGLGASLLAMRAAQSLLFGVGIYDRRTFAVSALSLTIICMIATWLPARRASAVDPTLALRSE